MGYGGGLCCAGGWVGLLLLAGQKGALAGQRFGGQEFTGRCSG